MPVNSKPFANRFRDDHAHPFDPGKFLRSREPNRVDAAECSSEFLGSGRTDMSHRQRDQHSPQRPRSRSVQLGEHGLGVLRQLWTGFALARLAGKEGTPTQVLLSNEEKVPLVGKHS